MSPSANDPPPVLPGLRGLLGPDSGSSLLPDAVRERLDAGVQGVGSGQAPPGTAAHRRRAAAGFVRAAAALRAAGRLADSIAPLRQAIAADPDEPGQHFDLGLTYLRLGRAVEALGPLLRAVELKPRFADAQYALGEAFEAVGRNGEAIAAYRRATECQPNFAQAHRKLGRALHRAERIEEAVASFRQAAKAGRGTTLGRVCEAHVLSEEGRFDEAAEVLRQVLARDKTSELARTTLGHTLANLGEIDAAVEQFQLALTLTDMPLGIWAALVQIKQLGEADRGLVAEMEAYVQRASLVPAGRMTLHFTLGKAYDDLQDYAQAMRHFDQANRIRGTLSPFDRDSLQRETGAVMATYTRQFFADHAQDGVDDDAPLLVFGMPRSGTTLVEQMVSSHPRVTGAGELTYWHGQWMALRKAGLNVADGATAKRAGAEYVSQLRRFSASAARITDKSLSNFHWLGLVLHAVPRARIIHCRRHPIDTCLSIYFTPFEAVLGFISDRDNLAFYYGQYQRIMAHWRSVLPPEQFMEVDYEALVAEPEGAARRLIDFCGLDWDPACAHPERNRRAVRTASVWQVRQPIYRRSVQRWRNYEPWLGALRGLAPPDCAVNP